MDKARLSIATMSWARNAAEEQLLRAAMGRLAEEEIVTFITDGGSNPEFINYLRAFPHYTVLNRSQPGVVPQTRQSLKAAYDRGSLFILYTESDKQWFFENRLRNFIVGAPDDTEVGIILAARSPESFATYPATQQYTESVSNRLCAESFGLEADYFYGPLIVHRDLIPYMERVGPEIGWGWRPFLCGVAHRLGYKIVPWVADLPCPLDQRENTPAERLHRLRQLSQNIQGLVLALSVAV